MGKNYSSYKDGLKELKLETLKNRRELLCIRFAKNCLKNQKMKNMFPLKKNKHTMKIRYERKYQTRKIKTTRLKKSSIPYMTKLLNDENKKKTEILGNDWRKQFFVCYHYICSSELLVHLSHESQTINVLFQISKLDRSRELQIWSGELQIRVLKFWPSNSQVLRSDGC